MTLKMSRLAGLLLLLLLHGSIMSVAEWQPAKEAMFSSVYGDEYGIEYETNTALVVQHLHDAVGAQIFTHANDPDMFQRIRINFDDTGSATQSIAFLRYLIHPENEHLRASVSDILITGYSSLSNATLLESAFGGLKQLDTVHWELSAAIPPSILRSLETNNPSARLYYKIFFDNWDTYDEDNPPIGIVGVENDHERRNMARQSILNSSNLYSLVGRIDYGGSPNHDDMRLVWQTLTTCPNLRELDLSIDRSGCVVSGGQPYSFDFLSNPNAAIPPLEVLRLDGYSFDETDNDDWNARPEWRDDYRHGNIYTKITIDASFMLKRLHTGFLQLLAGGPMQLFRMFKHIPPQIEAKKRTNLDEWMGAMDWSKLHTLNLKSGSGFFLETMKGNLPSVKHVSFRNTWKDDSSRWEDYLTNTTQPFESIDLTDISWKTAPKIIDAITTHHGGTLKHLGLICGCKNYFLNQSTISLIRSSCPLLETLEVEMDRNKTWNYPLLHELVSFPELRQLNLHFPGAEWEEFNNPNSEDPEEEARYDWYSAQRRPDDPLINKGSVVGLFRYLRRHKEGQDLEDLVVNVGQVSYRPLAFMGIEYRCFVDGFGMEVCEGRGPESNYIDFYP